MILELILDAIYSVIDTLLVFKIPGYNAEMASYVATGLQYINAGVSVVANYVNLSYILHLLSMIISIDICINLYHFIMWVIRKLPIASE